MQERISTLGGQMKVASRKGEGTKISITRAAAGAPGKVGASIKAQSGRALRGYGKLSEAGKIPMSTDCADVRSRSGRNAED